MNGESRTIWPSIESDMFASSTCRVLLVFIHVSVIDSSRLEPVPVGAPGAIAFFVTTTAMPHTLLEIPAFLLLQLRYFLLYRRRHGPT